MVDKSKINAYIFFGLFVYTKIYLNAYEDLKESILVGALFLGLIH